MDNHHKQNDAHKLINGGGGAYPHPLPDSGPRASEWMLDTLFGALKPGAWLAFVHNVDDGSQWEGGRYLDLSAALKTEPNAGHHFSTALIRAGETERTNATAESCVGVFFDDVGDMSVNPKAKIDKSLAGHVRVGPDGDRRDIRGQLSIFLRLRHGRRATLATGAGESLQGQP